MPMSDEADTLTITLSIAETFFLSNMVRHVAELEEGEASQMARTVARSIQQKLIDAAVMDGKIPIDHLPPPPEGDFDD